MLSTVLTLRKDSQSSVLLLSVHVIHKLSLCKSIKRCCQHEHQEIALMIDICLSCLWSVQAFYWQQSVWAGLHNMWQTTDFNLSGLCILACLGVNVGGRFLIDKMLYHFQLKAVHSHMQWQKDKASAHFRSLLGDEEWQRAERRLVKGCQWLEKVQQSSTSCKFSNMVERSAEG